MPSDDGETSKKVSLLMRPPVFPMAVNSPELPDSRGDCSTVRRSLWVQ